MNATLGTIGLTIALAAAPISPLSAQDRVPIPAPDLTGVDPVVATQLQQMHQELQNLATSAAAEPRALAETYGALGQLYLLYELDEAATACFLNANALAPADYRWPYYVGVIQQQNRRPPEALERFGEALERRPGDPPTMVRRAQAALAAGQSESAEAWFTELLGVEGAAAAAHYGLGEIAMQRQDYQTAVTHFEAALASQPEAQAAHYQLGLALRELGEFERAQEHLQKFGPVPVAFRDPLMEQLAAMGRGSGAHIMRASGARAAGDFARAAEEYRLALADDPDQIPARQALASTLVQLGDQQGAIDQLDEILSRDPDNASTHYNLGTLLAGTGQFDQALEHLARAVELAPDFVDGRINYAIALEQRQRYTEAEIQFREALTRQPDNIDALQRHAAVLNRLGRREEAVAVLRQALEHQPNDPEALLGLGIVLSQIGRTQEALTALQQVLQTEGTPQRQGMAYQTMAQILAQQGDSEAAIAAFRQSVSLQPSARAPRSGLANLLAELGRFDEAAEEFSLVVDANPEDQTAHLARAYTLLLAERYTEVLEALEESHAKFPANAALANALARLLATCPDDSIRNGERALALAEEIMQTEPGFEPAETLAMALAETGHLAEAVELQGRLVQRAIDTGQTQIVPILERRLRLYEAGQPVRAPWLAER